MSNQRSAEETDLEFLNRMELVARKVGNYYAGPGDFERLLRIAQAAKKTGCRECSGLGFVKVHQLGYPHYETDAGEVCPEYHYRRVPCAYCSDQQLSDGHEGINEQPEIR